MKRKILAMTTALTLALPAYAQSDAAMVARDTLERYGYDAAAMEMLTAAQITEIYLTTTSEDPYAVRQTLRGMNLSDAPSTAGEVTPEIEQVVVDTLQANGYGAGTIAVLSNAEVVEVYLASTSGDANALQSTLDGLEIPEGDMDMAAEWTVAVPSSGNIERVVTKRLMDDGYTMTQIATLTQAERAEIYLALTSDDPSGIQHAIDGAFES